MRIIRGKLKSRRFATPKKFPSRPTTDYAKEGLFNVLENMYSLEDLDILDLCAGTGNISMEFASREAGKITAVDTNYNCVSFIQKMVTENNLGGEVQVFKADVRDFLRKCDKTFDIIFADPPFDVTFHHLLVEEIFSKNLLKQNGLCIIEHGKQTNLSTLVNFYSVRNFGNVYFSFFKNIDE